MGNIKRKIRFEDIQSKILRRFKESLNQKNVVIQEGIQETEMIRVRLKASGKI